VIPTRRERRENGPAFVQQNENTSEPCNRSGFQSFPFAEMLARTVIRIAPCALLLGSIACSNDPNATRQQAANATEKLKQESKDATVQVKKGAEQARTDLTAVAQGVKDGINDKSSSSVDLNHATRQQLMALPGIGRPRADAIIAHRPYSNAHDVVTKRAISEDEYQNIASRVSVSR
jgi:DNA uptake protein ComE-like DNA-binding protein